MTMYLWYDIERLRVLRLSSTLSLFRYAYAAYHGFLTKSSPLVRIFSLV